MERRRTSSLKKKPYVKVWSGVSAVLHWNCVRDYNMENGSRFLGRYAPLKPSKQ